MICDVVVDCLGAVLTVIQAYPDGSYNCPSCGYGVQAFEPHCQNPACFTRPGYPPEHARRALAENAARKAAEAQRLRDHEAARRRSEEYRAQRNAEISAFIDLARAQGKCVQCALRSSKLIKHRGMCPARK